MNFKAIIPLIAGLCIGGFALKIGIDKLQAAKGAKPTSVELWKTAQDVPRGTTVVEELLEPLSFPEELVPLGAIRDKEELIERVARIDVPAGVPILDEMLLPPGARPGMHVKPGYRAVAVKIDASSGVDFHLEPGCRVDVVGSFRAKSGRLSETVARTFLENVEVSAVGPRISAVDGDGKRGQPTRAVTLLVKPDKVPLLHLAEQKGKIKLSMRSDADRTEGSGSEPVDDDMLLSGIEDEKDEKEETDEKPAGMLSWLFGEKDGVEPAPIPTELVLAAAAPPPMPEPEPDLTWAVIVYRGDDSEVVRFKDRNSRERVEPPDGKQSAGVPAALRGYMPPPPQRNLRPAPAQVVKALAGGDQNSGATDDSEDQEPKEPEE